MPRTPEQNERIRNAKKEIILDTALSLYVVFGYNGTDMDQVAVNAGVAKGLLYYYFKTKNIMFRELFSTIMKKISAVSESFFEKNSSLTPVEKLVLYSIDIFGLGISKPEYIQFAMRMPFDSYAVFGPKGWEDGMTGSRLHMDNLEKIIAEGIANGDMTCAESRAGANAYWTVFVSGLFNFTKMIGQSENNRSTENIESLEKLLAFGMNGLGVQESEWKTVLNKYREGKK